MSKEWTQACPLPPPPLIHKVVERTSKGNLFGLILQIFFPPSTTFPGTVSGPFPRQTALLEGRRSLSPALPHMRGELGEGVGLSRGILFYPSDLIN